MEFIQLGEKYDVGPWIKRGLYLLIQQPDFLSIDEMKNAGLSVETICLIFYFRDRSIVKTVVQVSTAPIYGSVKGKSAVYLKRSKSGIKEAAEEIFASQYSLYGGLGKDSLDLDSLFTKNDV